MKYGRGAVAAGDGCYFSRWDSAKPHSLDVYFKGDVTPLRMQDTR